MSQHKKETYYYFDKAIIRALRHLGGEAQLKQIYEIFPIYYKELSGKQRELHGGSPLYQHEIRERIYRKLIPGGDVEKVGRGIYALTEQGQRKEITPLEDLPEL